MQWFANQEGENKKWKKEMNYETIKKIALQSEFDFGTGSGCQAGFCTD
jgi:methylase of polypeptide subunit release factors